MNQVSPFAVLFVCTGNICRSPMGERLLEARLPRDRFEVASAGVMALEGWEMDPDAAAQLIALGGDPSGFKARQVNDRLLANADLILTATTAHRSRILEERPSALSRAFTMREFAHLVQNAEGTSPAELVAHASRHRSAARSIELDVPDPYQRGEEVHAVIAQIISAAVATIAGALGREEMSK